MKNEKKRRIVRIIGITIMILMIVSSIGILNFVYIDNKTIYKEDWNECYELSGSEQDKCYDYYEITWPEETDRGHYVNRMTRNATRDMFLVLLLLFMLITISFYYFDIKLVNQRLRRL